MPEADDLWVPTAAQLRHDNRERITQLEEENRVLRAQLAGLVTAGISCHSLLGAVDGATPERRQAVRVAIGVALHAATGEMPPFNNTRASLKPDPIVPGEFEAYLLRARREVDTWPAWQRDLFGKLPPGRRKETT